MKTTALFLALLGLSWPGAAAAGGWGPRVGVAVDPDLIQFGLHGDLGNLSSHVSFQPNAELGVGDDLTMLTVNLDIAYRFASRWDVWSPYLGGGMGVHFISYEDGFRDGDDTEAGAAVLGGIQRGLQSGNRFFLETRIGIFDAPDVTFMAGWTFR